MDGEQYRQTKYADRKYIQDVKTRSSTENWHWHWHWHLHRHWGTSTGNVVDAQKHDTHKALQCFGWKLNVLISNLSPGANFRTSLGLEN